MKALFSLLLLLSLNAHGAELNGTWKGSALFQSTLEKEPMILADMTVTVLQSDTFVSLTECVTYSPEKPDFCQKHFYTINNGTLETGDFVGPVGKLTENGFVVGIQDQNGGIMRIQFERLPDGTSSFSSLLQDSENKIEVAAEVLAKGLWNAGVTEALEGALEADK